MDFKAVTWVVARAVWQIHIQGRSFMVAFPLSRFQYKKSRCTILKDKRSKDGWPLREMLCDLESTFGFTTWLGCRATCSYGWSKAGNHSWALGILGSRRHPVGECLRLALLEFTGVSKLRSSCTVDIGFLPSLLETAGPHIELQRPRHAHCLEVFLVWLHFG